MSQTTIIHVLPSVVRENVAKDKDDPAIIVRQDGIERLANVVEIRHNGKVVARICPNYNNPIPDGMGEGARVWVETTEEVTLHQESWLLANKDHYCTTQPALELAGVA